MSMKSMMDGMSSMSMKSMMWSKSSTNGLGNMDSMTVDKIVEFNNEEIATKTESDGTEVYENDDVSTS